MAKARNGAETAQDELGQAAGADIPEEAQGGQSAPETGRSTDPEKPEEPLGFENGGARTQIRRRLRISDVRLWSTR